MENLENDSHLKNFVEQNSSLGRNSESLRGGASSASLQSLEIRCPECFKLYMVDLREVPAVRPQYKCTGCEQKFWFDTKMVDGGTVLGLPLEWLDSGLDLKTPGSHQVDGDKTLNKDIQLNCPSCDSDYSPGDSECGECGIVFAKYEKTKWTSFVEASKTLKMAWEKVIFEYEDETVHSRFIKACQKELNLEYASSKYGAILKANPNDELAQAMVHQIMAITSLQMQTPKEIKEAPKRKSYWGRLIWGLLFFASGSLIVTGYLIPPLRNLIGIGVALLFIGGGLKFGFRHF